MQGLAWKHTPCGQGNFVCILINTGICIALGSFKLLSVDKLSTFYSMFYFTLCKTYTINNCTPFQFDGTHIVSGSLDTSIRVWDVETGQCLHTLIGHQSLTSGMELKDSILVSGNADSTVKVWDIKTGHCLQTLQGR